MRTGPALKRRLPAGAEYEPGRGAHFRVWAPRARRVELRLENAAGVETGRRALAPEAGGYHGAFAPGIAPGALYRYLLDGEGPFPDPASRYQPQGPHGPSQLVDPAAYAWRDADWKGASLEGQVIYELHLGTFTPEGSWEAAARLFPRLQELGATMLEVMPVADFPGRFGWGYDGVNLYAPTRLYGAPDDMRRFVDRAHAAGLAVILDVVYNHLGPDGNYLPRFSERYFKERATEWGEAINFDGEDSGPVREFYAANAAYWISEFHLDGLRLDATQHVYDESEPHILAELARAARAAAGGRPIVLIAENETQDARLARPVERGGLGLDALWNDDFHHSARVALTGSREAYYGGYRGGAQELMSAVKRGFLYQGQYYPWQKKRRGRPALDLRPASFVHCLENHDQVANSFDGRRLHQLCRPGELRALTALLLLGPQTPMLFQGQEFASSAPFLYFADHESGLAEAVAAGRRRELSQFPSIAAAAGLLSEPSDRSTFERSKLDHSEWERNAHAAALHRDLLALRRADPVFRAQGGPERLDGAALAPRTLALRFFGVGGDDRLLVVNLGVELDYADMVEPLLCPPEDALWRLIWSSESPEYGGRGARAPVSGDQRWRIPAACACVLRAERA